MVNVLVGDFGKLFKSIFLTQPQYRIKTSIKKRIRFKVNNLHLYSENWHKIK